MQTVYRCCAGMDVHKRTVEVTVRRMDRRDRVRVETRSYRTLTQSLMSLLDWLLSCGVTHAAMESTGVFWKPIYNILEGHLEVLLVNARHVKQVPGRKTDVSDSQWLAHLLQCGLLRPSFVPPRPIRELRDLTRHRTQLVAEKTRTVNRIHKTLQDANIKLSDVATDLQGASCRDMIQALLAGKEDPEELAELARGRLRGKIPQLRSALEGRITEHHHFMLDLLWSQLASVEDYIERIDARIEEKMRPYQADVDRLDEIPGVDRRNAENIVAELGPDMSWFPTDRHVASWAGMCPGNHESAGKRKSGRTTKGSRWLRQTLVLAACAASRAKDSYLSAQYRRLVRRRGNKRARVAVGHSILVAAYHMLREKTPYRDLGADFFERLNPEGLTRYHVRCLERLGHEVDLRPRESVA